MIVLTLAGESSRFFKENFKVVKYKLPLINKKTILECILEEIPKENKILVVLNKKFNDRSYVEGLLKKLGFKDNKVIEISYSRGQLETVGIALLNTSDFWGDSEHLTIFNGDTIRKSKVWSFDNCDGCIEVFEGKGDHWSFVDKLGEVHRVEEKIRISKFCSSGLYYFRSISLFLRIIDNYQNDKEWYVAPFYNQLIKNKKKVISKAIPIEDLVFCGTPNEYWNSVKALENT